jgi:hypothetical protein
VLRITLKTLPRGARLHATITFAHHATLYFVTHKTGLHRHVPRPKAVVLHLSEGSRAGATVTVKP